MRHAMTFVLLVVAGFAALTSAYARPDPAKPVRVITPFSAGTAVDTVARVVGKQIGDALGQQVVIARHVRVALDSGTAGHTK